MANVIKKATNKFTKGLVMDFSPENTRNEVLTHALNATLLTFNGNEMSLQNDMGNARVETAYLPEGYIPVGTCEFGGIIYIVSYNPLEDKSLIGCFPSPERNISSDELGESTKTSITFSDFQIPNSEGKPTGELKNVSKYVLLKNDKLNPGDKFIIYANESISDELLVGLEKFDGSKFEPVSSNPILALNIVSIEDSGKITYLNSDVINYEYLYNNNTYRYHILGKSATGTDNTLSTPDLDAYRTVLSSGYSVFKSKTSGKLAILAELITIDSYSVTHRVEEVKDENNQTIPDKYNIVLYPEVSCEETENKYGVVPKLSYYYLLESDGKLLLSDDANDNDAKTDNNTNRKYKSLSEYTSFLATTLKNVWSDLDSRILTTTDSDGNTIDYTIDMLYNEYYNSDNYKSNTELKSFNFSSVLTYHKDVYNSNDINSILLGTIILPDKILNNSIGLSLQLPFTYKYTIVPCMSYGKLQNLAVSNTINFFNINNFGASKFNVWKYRVDGPTVHLQFGAEIYDTNVDPVTALVLEFYDLWGFAGSIIIDNKKAYSGVFTKILTLNSMNLLSIAKVPNIENIGDTIEGGYTYDYQRNIKIVKEWKTIGKHTFVDYKLNDEKVSYTDKGWRADDKDIENDCGTLYSNLIYGVKAYFVLDIPNSDKQKFTLKDLFFMFTNPLFNDYYYTKSNFNELINPELDFVLTSRIKDNSIKESLNYKGSTLEILNGYKKDSKIEEYLKGISQETTIQDTKYYKYTGTSELQLEIGLKKDYSDIGLMYDRNINKYFKCTLELVNNDNDGTWSVESDSGITDLNTLLNYHEDELKSDNTLNLLAFDSGSTCDIPINTFQEYHFLDPNNQSGKHIPISYQFVVGYNISIDDIRLTQIPATTVCALCHKRDDGTYNYEDFGIEEGVGSDGSVYFSNTIFYNSGTNTNVEFGLCRQLSTSGKANEQCEQLDSCDYSASKIQIARLLNAGNPLKLMVLYIGKLSFCEPYLGGYSDSNGVSVSPINGSLWINPDLSQYVGTPHHGTSGVTPSNGLYLNPLYLLCLNTKNMIDRQSEFAVNMDRYVDSVTGIYIGYDKNGPLTFEKQVSALKLIGLTGEQLTQYNKKLLETMKRVYAYNPDYDSLSVRVGDVSISDNKVKFTSNIICHSADIDFSKTNKTLNDFVSIGNISLSDYFNSLHQYSNISVKKDNAWIPQINFIANIDYCGGHGNKALVSTLTYNTPEITDLYNELTLSDDSIVIRHEDGNISSIKGDLNKKVLYGYMKDKNSLIQLDVSNYKIDSNGNLILKDFTNKIEQTYHFTANDINLEEALSDTGHNKEISLPNGKTITINIKFKVTDNNTIGSLKKSKIDDPSHLFLLIDTNTDSSGSSPLANLNINIKVVENESYDLEFSNESFKIKTDMGTVFLTSNTPSETLINMSDIDLLDLLRSLTYLNEIGLRGSPYIENSSEEKGSYSLKIKLYDKNSVELNYLIIPNSSYGITYLMSLLIDDIYFTVTTNEVLSLKNDIYSIIPTLNYYIYDLGKYIVDSLLYPDTVIKGTNITLNDLVYEPKIDGHRLYMRPHCFKYYNKPVSVFHYRTLTPDKDKEISETWLGTTYYYNMLFINTGPCFIPDNLS